jgi:hypothetical protein
MNETERAAWAAFDAAIIADAQAAGLVDVVARETALLKAEQAIRGMHRAPIVQGPLAKETPHRCPNCGGAGKRVYPNLTYNYGGTTATYTAPQQCHSCEGSGVLWR